MKAAIRHALLERVHAGGSWGNAVEGRGSLVIVPLMEEMEYIHQFLLANNGTTVTPFDRHRDRYTFEYSMANRHQTDIAFQVLGDMGNVVAATRSLSALMEVYPRRCYLIGLAGSLEPGTKLGDVAIATGVKIIYADKVKRIDPETEVFGTESGTADGKITIDIRKKFLSDSFLRFRWASVNWKQSEFAASRYLRHLQTASPLRLEPVAGLRGLAKEDENPSPKIFTATILGSDMVIDSDEFVEFIRDRNDDQTSDYYRLKFGERIWEERSRWIKSELCVVDMESFGYFMLAEALDHGPEFPQHFSVRGVSDFSSNKARLQTDTENEVRRRAIMNALIVTLDMIEFFEAQRAR